MSFDEQIIAAPMHIVPKAAINAFMLPKAVNIERQSIMPTTSIQMRTVRAFTAQPPEKAQAYSERANLYAL